MSARSVAEMLRPEHAQHLARFRIAPEILKAAGVRSVTDADGRETLGLSGYRDANMTGILFPYLSPITGMCAGGRIRLDEPIPDDGGRYISEPGCRHLFFSPGITEFLRDANVPVVLVEAEKSALALTALAARASRKLLVIAIGGCWGWRRKIGRRPRPNGGSEPETGPSPDLDLITWEGRQVFLAFDSNAESNLDVQRARCACAHELASRGASAFIAKVPAIDGVNGPDDLIAVSGDEALLSVLNSALPFEANSRSVTVEWTQPAPLGEELLPVPEFVLELLPASFRPLVEDVSERMQTPLDYAAAAAVVALAGCVNRRAIIKPKAEDLSWSVVPNLWGAIVGPPGFMKSPVLRTMTLPLVHIEELWGANYSEEVSEYETAKEQAELRHLAWREEYKRAIKKGETIPIQPDKTVSAPPQKRLALTDATFEKLHEIHSENPAGVFVVRDELTGWLAQLNKPGREGERGFFLQAWNGDAGFTVDRIGRGSIHVPAVCVSLLGNIQPSRLRAYLSGVLEGGPYDDGLFQRFQILVWPDASTKWRLVDRPLNAGALREAENVYSRLANLSADDPIRMRFCPEAQILFYEWWFDLENELRTDSGSSPSLIAHFAKYRSLMPTLAGLFELADRVAVNQGEEILTNLDHSKQAAAFCELLHSHARRVYACIATPELRGAHELARHINTRDIKDAFTPRSIYLKGWSGLDTPDRVRGALTLLEDAGWIRRAELHASRSGGRPSELWMVNPKVIRHA